MTNEQKTFRFGGAIGGSDAWLVQSMLFQLAQIFELFAFAKYSESILHFNVAYYVGGYAIEVEEKETSRSIRYYKKDKSVNASVHVPSALWRDKSTSEVREVLASKFEEAFFLFLGKARSVDLHFQTEHFTSDIECALSEFRNQSNTIEPNENQRAIHLTLSFVKTLRDRLSDSNAPSSIIFERWTVTPDKEHEGMLKFEPLF